VLRLLGDRDPKMLMVYDNPTDDALRVALEKGATAVTPEIVKPEVPSGGC
jgi:hypothetical protein